MKTFIQRNCSSILLIIVILFTAVTGFLIMRYVTDNGIGVSPDSVAYMETANNLLAGRGFTYAEAPLTHFPPMYPLILAGSGLFNPDVNTSARWLHISLYCLNALLFGFTLYFSARRSMLAVVLGVILFFSSPALLHIHAFAWSEPPFLTFTLILLLSLGFYMRQRKWVFLIVASLTLGFAMVTRYAGVALAPALALCLMLCPQTQIRQRIKHTLAALIIAFTPLGAWVLRNFFLTSAATDRDFQLHLVTKKQLVTLFNTLHGFFLPNFSINRLNRIELFIIAILVLFMLFKISKYSPGTIKLEPERVFWVSFGFLASAVYLAFLLLSLSVYDAYMPLDERILFPVFLFFMISIFATVREFAHTRHAQSAWLILMVSVVFIIRINLPTMMEAASGYHFSGLGYNKVSWNKSETLEVLSAFPQDTRLYSNGHDVIRFKTGLRAQGFPAKYSPITTEPNEKFQEEMASMCADVNQGKALLVFLTGTRRDYHPSKDEVVILCNNPRLLLTTEDGAIFGQMKP